MVRNDVIKLIKEKKVKNSLGVFETTLEYKDVFCNVTSVTMSEFFEGGRNGFKPEYRMTMFGGDYDEEEILEYKGQTYSIYRTYRSNTDRIDLYVERKGGTNGKDSNH